MKKIKLVVVGKLKEKFFADACSEYLKRLQRFATVTVTELKDKDGSDEIVKESDDILRAIEGKVFLTDIGGELLSSEQLSASMKNAFLQSDTITFVIGGSRGVDDRVRSIADKQTHFVRTNDVSAYADAGNDSRTDLSGVYHSRGVALSQIAVSGHIKAYVHF